MLLAARLPACRWIELTPLSPPALYTQRILHPGLGQAPLSLPVCLLASGLISTRQVHVRADQVAEGPVALVPTMEWLIDPAMQLVQR